MVAGHLIFEIWSTAKDDTLSGSTLSAQSRSKVPLRPPQKRGPCYNGHERLRRFGVERINRLTRARSLESSR